MLFVEGGPGFIFSNDATALIVRGRIDCSDYATWNGKNANEAFGLSRGVQWQTTEHGAVILSEGLSHIDRTTSNLGQPFEFFGRLAYEQQVGATIVSLGWIHISDAKFLFGWSGNNNGENFLTLSLGIPF